MSILAQLNRRIFSRGPTNQNPPSSQPPPRNERRSPFRPQFREGWRKRIPGSTQGVAPGSSAAPIAPIYVWASKVETLVAAAANFGLLNEDDQAALQVLRDPSTKESSAAARILLRLSLSAMTGRRIAPQEWQFARNDHGKPFIKGISEGIEFSVSHVDDVVATAIGCGVSVGIDIESVDQPLEDAVFDHFCHESERETLDALPMAQRRRVFLELWTRKEAYTKMLGLGHSLEFQSLNALKSQDDKEPALAHTERFYFSVDHSLYHGTLVVERKIPELPIDIQFMDAVLPGRTASTACF
jgi:phosphopantetheinyl transferase